MQCALSCGAALRSWIPVLLVAAFAAAAAPARAAAQGVVVEGRVREAGGAPVAAARLRVAEAGSSGAATAVSDSAGGYRLVLPPGAGPWELKVERVGFYGLTVVLHPAPGEARIRRDLVLSARDVVLDPVTVQTAPPVNRPPAAGSPGGRDEAGLAVFDLDRPVPPGDLAALAALQPGVLSLGDGGLSIAGQAASRNGVTLDGASFGALTLPAEALRSTAVARSTYDPSRGQFSGGQIASTTLSGTNHAGGAARLALTHPAVQAGGGPGGRTGQEWRSLQFGGGAGGALVRDRFFWYGAVQGSLRTEPLVTLATADGRVLRELGVHPDSALRLQQITRALGYAPPVPGASRGTDAGAALLRLDWVLGSSHVLMTRLDARTSRLGGLGESPAALPGGGGDLREGSAGVMTQLTSYPGAARNELRVYAASGSRRPTPDWSGPGAAVRVASTRDGGGASQALLRFGGGGLALAAGETSLLEIADDLVLAVPGGHGRARVGWVLNRETAVQRGAPDPFGTFTFNSLAELEDARPARYVRTLGDPRDEAASELLGAYAAHLWQPHPDLSLIYGVRLEGRRYRGGAVDESAPAPFGARTGVAPGEWGVSPRLGLRYDAPSRAWGVRGGLGEFRGRFAPGTLAPALGETGTARQLRLECVGPAAPAPDWRSAGAGGPAACADGAPAFAAQSPAATLFAPGFAVPRTWRATLGWSADRRTRPGLVGVSLEGGWTHGLAQPVAYDRNLAADDGFTLPAEGGRRVLAPAGAVDSLTGGIAPGAARVLPALAAVREVSARGRSLTTQLTVESHLLTPRLTVLAASYTFTVSRDQVGALAAPGGASEPLSGAVPRTLTTSAADVDRRHLVQAQWSQPLHRWGGDLSLAGRMTSGAPFTPRVAGDVNGDGLSNDAAFVFDPATADSALAAGMAGLLRTAPPRAVACLRRQLGRVAGRNSCRGQWTGELDLQASFWPGQDRRSRRFTVTATATNLLAGADRLLHGAGGLHGWGQTEEADPTLLYLTGFDPRTRAFRYDVNPAFGAAGGGGSRVVARQPFHVILQGRWTFGADPVRQPLTTVLSTMRVQGRTPAQLRDALAATVPNLAAQALALGDTLRLSDAQREQLRAAAAAFGVRAAPVVDSLAAALSTAESTADARRERDARARVQELSRAAQKALDAAGEELRRLLTPEQWNRLPVGIQRPSRQILPARGGFTLSTGEVW